MPALLPQVGAPGHPHFCPDKCKFKISTTLPFRFNDLIAGLEELEKVPSSLTQFVIKVTGEQPDAKVHRVRSGGP